MDILEKSIAVSALYDLYTKLKYKNYPIIAIGTSSLASQNYTSDYDLMTVVKDRSDAYQAFKKILDEFTKISKLYFVEFKIQQMDGTKYKIFKIEDFNQEYFKHFSRQTKFCKLDGLIFIDGYFKEFSINYLFKSTKENLYKKLVEEKEEQYHKGNFFKALKRLFSATRYAKIVDKELLVRLTRFFNSELGKVYTKYSQLEAIKLFVEKTGNLKMANIVLSNIGLKGLKIHDISMIAADYKKLLDIEALKHYDDFEQGLKQTSKNNIR